MSGLAAEVDGSLGLSLFLIVETTSKYQTSTGRVGPSLSFEAHIRVTGLPREADIRGVSWGSAAVNPSPILLA